MNRFHQFLNKFLGEEEGQTAVEYAVMLASIISVSGMSADVLGYRVNQSFDATAAVLDGETSSPAADNADASADEPDTSAADAAAAQAAADAAATAAAAAAVEAGYNSSAPTHGHGHGGRGRH